VCVVGNDTESGSEEEAELTLRAELEGIQVGDITVPASSLTGFQRTQLNESSGDSDARTTFAYVANADATAIEQEISFHRRPERGNFFGRSFGIAPHSFKWSLRLSSTNSSSSSAVEYTTVRYRVTRVLASNSSLAAPLDLNASITHQRGVPEANMTTYYVPLPIRSSSSSTRASSRAVAKVEVFDVVLLADADYCLSLTPIEHSLSFRSTSRPDGVDVAEFVLELRFPPFNGSLAYDPSLGIGVLLGSDDGDGGGSSGGSDMALVIGVAVALPIAAVLVVLAISAGVAIGWWLRKRETTKSVARGDSVNFHYLDSSALCGLFNKLLMKVGFSPEGVVCFNDAKNVLDGDDVAWGGTTLEGRDVDRTGEGAAHLGELCGTSVVSTYPPRQHAHAQGGRNLKR
jgi:hypothetical protein